MKKNFGDPTFDIRTLERALREGNVEQKDYEKHLKDLQDEAGNAEEVPVFDEGEESQTDELSEKEPTFSV